MTAAAMASVMFRPASGTRLRSALLANAGAINGCGDGTFHPNQAISRAQFVTILAGIYGVNASGRHAVFRCRPQLVL